MIRRMILLRNVKFHREIPPGPGPAILPMFLQWSTSNYAYAQTMILGVETTIEHEMYVNVIQQPSTQGRVSRNCLVMNFLGFLRQRDSVLWQSRT